MLSLRQSTTNGVGAVDSGVDRNKLETYACIGFLNEPRNCNTHRQASRPLLFEKNHPPPPLLTSLTCFRLISLDCVDLYVYTYCVAWFSNDIHGYELVWCFTLLLLLLLLHARLSLPPRNITLLYMLSTHSLGVEGGPRWVTGNLYDRERVPFTAADHGRVDVDVGPRLERVSPEKADSRNSMK